jgi:hypothetical protein
MIVMVMVTPNPEQSRERRPETRDQRPEQNETEQTRPDQTRPDQTTDDRPGIKEF